MDTIIIKNINPKKNIDLKKITNISLDNALVSTKDIHSIIKYDIFNPPFFKKIIIQDNELSTYELSKIYNTCLVDGMFYYPKKYDYFFKSNKSKIYKKIDNDIYYLDNRTIDFIIMGTQRGGTTSLGLNISKHPKIHISTEKNPETREIHFYDLNWKKGLDWYKKQLKYYKNEKKIIGEKTPDLMYLDYTFPLIQSVNPFVKLIIILRNPVQRAYSHWKLNRKNNNEDLSFNKAVSFELKNLNNQNKTFFTSNKHYIRRGYYYKQLVKMLKWFPKQNILVLISEKVKEDMNKEYNKVYKFLNIKNLNNTQYKLEHISTNKSSINPLLYKKLINMYKKDIKSLEKLFDLKTDWI